MLILFLHKGTPLCKKRMSREGLQIPGLSCFFCPWGSPPQILPHPEWSPIFGLWTRVAVRIESLAGALPEAGRSMSFGRPEENNSYFPHPKIIWLLSGDPAKLSIRATTGPRAKNRGPLRVGEDLRRASPRGGKTRKSRNLEDLPAHPLFA